MFDSPKELLDKIRLGEDSLLELKEVRFAGERVSGPHRDSLADELAAFANSHSGVCVLASRTVPATSSAFLSTSWMSWRGLSARFVRSRFSPRWRR